VVDAGPELAAPVMTLHDDMLELRRAWHELRDLLLDRLRNRWPR
jgi:hypothetical protein